MRKTRKNRTPKKERDEAEKAKYKVVISKSKAGVVYKKQVLVLPKNPAGFNHSDRARLDAIDKRMKQGREYYIYKGSKRVYAKE